MTDPGVLDRTAAEVRERWALVNDGALPMRNRYVEPVRRADGTPAVLKVGPAGDGDFDRELDAVEWFSGHGGVEVLALDRERGALLMERVFPGAELRELALEDDEAATEIAAGVMERLWLPAPATTRLPTVGDWGEESLTGHDAAVFSELCDSSGAPVVLHGDLHHENILRSGEGWVAIDPAGVIGEREYEIGALMHNPWPGLLDLPRPGRILARRLDLLAERLGFDRDRLAAWAWVIAKLSAAWCVDDREDPAFPLACADLLAPLTSLSTPSRRPAR
jgi:streptomycin 6-kinase